jgi:hypothetical protein
VPRTTLEIHAWLTDFLKQEEKVAEGAKQCAELIPEMTSFGEIKLDKHSKPIFRPPWQVGVEAKWVQGVGGKLLSNPFGSHLSTVPMWQKRYPYPGDALSLILAEPTSKITYQCVYFVHDEMIVCRHRVVCWSDQEGGPFQSSHHHGLWSLEHAINPYGVLTANFINRAHAHFTRNTQAEKPATKRRSNG